MLIKKNKAEFLSCNQIQIRVNLLKNKDMK